MASLYNDSANVAPPKEFTSGMEDMSTLPRKLQVGPTIYFPPTESITSNGNGGKVGKMQNDLSIALNAAMQDLLIAVEIQERRKRKKTRKGKKQEPDIEPLAFIAEHLIRNNKYHDKMNLKRSGIVKQRIDEFNLKAGIVRESVEMATKVVKKAGNRHYYKIQKINAIKEAEAKALAAKARRSPKGRKGRKNRFSAAA
jgi:hypothetical protein